MLDDQLQELTTDTCEIFQLSSYKHLLDPHSNSKILNDEFLTKKIVSALLNEIFSTNKEKKRRRNEIFAKDNNLWLRF